MDLVRLWKLIVVVIALIVIASLLLGVLANSSHEKAIIAVIAAIVANGIWTGFIFYQMFLEKRGLIDGNWKRIR